MTEQKTLTWCSIGERLQAQMVRRSRMTSRRWYWYQERLRELGFRNCAPWCLITYSMAHTALSWGLSFSSCSQDITAII